MNRFFARTLLQFMRPQRVQLFDQLCQDQWLPADTIEEDSRRRLGLLLRYAATHVPHYRNHVFEAGLDPGTLGPNDLQLFPLIAKSTMMDATDNFRSEEAAAEQFHPNATGGSSGVWFDFFIDRHALEVRTANDLRGRTWTGWRLGDKQAVLWGHPRDNRTTHSLRGKLLADFVHRSRNMNAYDMDDRVIADYFRQLKSWRPVMMLGYSSALAFLADYLTREELELTPPKGIISSAETLTEEHRKSIEGYFGCPLLNRYGSREFGVLAQQCEVGEGMHVPHDRVRLEILRPDGSPCGPGERGEIVVTDLDNWAMPFIRYRTGDLAVPTDGTCSCGRGFPILERVEGRTSELIVGKNGKYYSCQSPRLFGADIPGIRQMQLIQDTVEAIEIKIVPGYDWNEEGRRRLVDRMTELLGDTVVTVNEVDEIPPAPSGKYPFTISKVSPFGQQRGDS